MKKIMFIFVLLLGLFVTPAKAVTLNEDGSIRDSTLYYTYHPFIVSFNYNWVQFQCVDLKEVVTIKVYRATSKDGKYYSIGSCNGAGEFKAKDLVCGKSYWFKFIATYYDGHKETRYLKASADLFPIPYIKRTTSKMTWNKVDGAHGYIIYRANKGSKTLRKIGSTTKTSYAASKKYDYYIKPYRKVNGKYVYAHTSISQALK